MVHPLLPVTLLALAAPVAAMADGPELLAQLTIRERVVIRVPRMAPPPPPAHAVAPPIRWKEKKGPKCVAAADLGGALVSEPGSVDLVMTGNRRVRAALDDDCGPLDFYSGFYIRPASDGQVCAGRDAIRVRSGGVCAIERFRRLVADK